MKRYFLSVFLSSSITLAAQGISSLPSASVTEMDNAFFKQDNYWRGADGAATIDLKNGKVLWLFSDTFIDRKGKGRRSNRSTMIRNSLAIQHGYDPTNATLTYHYRGSEKAPLDYFEVPGDTWFWTGHGVRLGDKLIVFLIEEQETSYEPGFEAIGWYAALVDNPDEHPDAWSIRYIKGSDTGGFIVGSSAVLVIGSNLYAYGVREPSTHEVILFRWETGALIDGDFSQIECWMDSTWTKRVDYDQVSPLFTGQTEFSVHYDSSQEKYIQIQTHGFGSASIGYRMADRLEGPWSEPNIIYTTKLQDPGQFAYTANAHPEMQSDGILITYNVNSADFRNLMTNENIYFPRVIKLNLR